MPWALALLPVGVLALALTSSPRPASARARVALPYSGAMSESKWTQEQKLAAADPRLRLPELLARLRRAGWQPEVAFTWRSLETQAELQRLRRTTVDFSFHNALNANAHPSALAADVYDRRFGWGDDPGTDRTRGAAAFFAALGREAKSLGLAWGGDWARSTPLWAAYGMGWDPAHVQALPNDALAAVRAASMNAIQRATARA